MKLLFDENLPPSLVRLLADLFPDSSHVHQCALGGSTDDAIWEYARENGFAVVSKDSHFAQKGVLEENPPKFVWLRIGNTSPAETEDILRRNAILIHRLSERRDQVYLAIRRPPRSKSARPRRT